MTQEIDAAEYKRQYDEAAAKLDAAAEPAITAPVEVAAPASPAATTETPATPAAEVAPPAEATAPDPMAELTARLERAEKMVKDNQAYATRMAQEAAQLRRQQDAREREAAKPAILDANPELADAIRYVAADPAPAQEQADYRTAYQSVIERAHPDAFAEAMPKELQDAIASAWEGLGDGAQDPLNVVRVITEQKLAHVERLNGQRLAAEVAKQNQISAMSVPSPGASSVAVAPVDAQLALAQRIHNMTDREFEAEAKRVRGF